MAPVLLTGRSRDAGVSAVVHTASIMTLGHDPTEIIPGVIAYATNALKAAYDEPSVKRFVYCSSSTAAVLSVVGRPGVVVTEETFNEDAVREAWAPPPYTPERSHAVYSASKTLAEQAIWKYYRENADRRPDIVVNTGLPSPLLTSRQLASREIAFADGSIVMDAVLPNMTLGKSLDPVNQGYSSTVGMVALLYRGQIVDYHRAVPRRMLSLLSSTFFPSRFRYMEWY